MEEGVHLVAECSRTITDALISPRNLIYPKLKVKLSLKIIKTLSDTVLNDLVTVMLPDPF